MLIYIEYKQSPALLHSAQLRFAEFPCHHACLSISPHILPLGRRLIHQALYLQKACLQAATVRALLLNIFKAIETYLYRYVKSCCTMKNTTIIGIMLLALIFIFAAGCRPDAPGVNVTVSPEPDVEINPITGEPYYDIVEKRGVQTNITEFNELVVRASNIDSFKYSLTDTAIGDEEYEFLVRGRFVRILLPEPTEHDTGEVYDEILMDRKTKTALSHCSIDLCPKPDIDRELEKVDYDDYYISDPMEYLYKATDAELVKEEMLGDQYTKVYSVMYEGRPARIWLQEYYGFPIKIIVRNEDDSKRMINFEEMMVNNVRRGEIDPPFNFTVKGEGDRKWWTWEHYLGELDDEGKIIQPGSDPMLGV